MACGKSSSKNWRILTKFPKASPLEEDNDPRDRQAHAYRVDRCRRHRVPVRRRPVFADQPGFLGAEGACRHWSPSHPHELRRCRASDDHPSRCGDWGGGGDGRSGGCCPCACMRPGRQCLWPDNLPLSLIDTGWSRIRGKRRGCPWRARARAPPVKTSTFRACLTGISWCTVVSISITPSKTFVLILDPVCRACSHTRLKIIYQYNF